MPKSSIIYGEKQLVKLNQVNFTSIQTVIKTYVGDAPVSLSAAQGIVRDSLADKAFKGKDSEAYVKVGVVEKHLVLRCKLSRKLMPDIERDAIIVRNWDNFVAANPPATTGTPPPRPTTPTPWVNGIGRTTPEPVEEETTESEDDTVSSEEEKTESSSESESSSTESSLDGQGSSTTAPKKPETEEEKAARLERLREVLQRPREDGESLADRFKRAAAKANKLGMTEESRQRMEEQGLQPLHEDYRGEVLDHQKNRYGRFLGPMQKIWEAAGANKTHSLSEWLDAIERNDTGVAGVKEGRTYFDESHNGEAPPTQGGGKVVYLDDITRQPYQASVSNGAISGGMIGGDGQYIFVIGPDNRLYAGNKARAAEGQTGAFNHSSFFSGGPVKSAGTLIVSGGRIAGISNQSGHYAPSEDMIKLACRAFSQDKATLRKMQVQSGKGWVPASVFLSMETVEEAEQARKGGKSETGTTGGDTKPSPEEVKRTAIKELALKLTRHPAFHGNLGREGCEQLLTGKEKAWLLRQGSSGMVLSVCQGGKVNHALLGDGGSTAESFAHLIAQRDPGAMVKPGAPTGGVDKQSSPEETRRAAVNDLAAKLTRHAAFHGNIDRPASEQLLSSKEKAWLLRQGSAGMVLSVYQGGKAIHCLLGSEAYPTAESFAHEIAQRDPGAMVGR